VTFLIKSPGTTDGEGAVEERTMSVSLERIDGPRSATSQVCVPKREKRVVRSRNLSLSPEWGIVLIGTLTILSLSKTTPVRLPRSKDKGSAKGKAMTLGRLPAFRLFTHNPEYKGKRGKRFAEKRGSQAR